MINQETAKEILGGLHPEDHTIARASGELDLGAALDLLESDPELQAWYEQELAFDAVISSCLVKAAQPPAGLRDNLLASLQSAAAPAAADKIVPFRGGWILAAAAAVVLLGVGVKIAFNSDNGDGTKSTPPIAQNIISSDGISFVSFRDGMADYAKNNLSLGHKASDWKELNSWLSTKTKLKCGDLPKSIASLNTMGCNVVDWGKTHVSLYCFAKGENGEVVHLFVIDKASLGDVPPCSILCKPLEAEGLETAGWQDEEKVYLLIGSKPGVHVSELL
jgi:hypothetical protein